MEEQEEKMQPEDAGELYFDWNKVISEPTEKQAINDFIKDMENEIHTLYNIRYEKLKSSNYRQFIDKVLNLITQLDSLIKNYDISIFEDLKKVETKKNEMIDVLKTSGIDLTEDYPFYNLSPLYENAITKQIQSTIVRMFLYRAMALAVTKLYHLCDEETIAEKELGKFEKLKEVYENIIKDNIEQLKREIDRNTKQQETIDREVKRNEEQSNKISLMIQKIEEIENRMKNQHFSETYNHPVSLLTKPLIIETETITENEKITEEPKKEIYCSDCEIKFQNDSQLTMHNLRVHKR